MQYLHTFLIFKKSAGDIYADKVKWNYLYKILEQLEWDFLDFTRNKKIQKQFR